MTEGKQKFDGLSTDYDRFRPRYPDTLLRHVTGLVAAAEPVVVDAGAGTGIELEGLSTMLGPRARISAVDLSADMVAVGRTKFPDVAWSIEPVEPFLERAHDVDLIVAAQSFQWMDRPRFLRAAGRCLNGSGVVAIIQNNRDFDASPFLADYEALLEELSPGYSRRYRAFGFAAELTEHLGPLGAAVEVTTANWTTRMPVGDFVGMSRSSTQAQRAIAEPGSTYLARLDELLDRHTTGGDVTIPYHTELFTAQLPVRAR